MKRFFGSMCVIGLAALLGATTIETPKAEASNRIQGRQYYGTWSYNEINRYHYRQYHYKPVVTATTYSYHYVIHYPTQPRYHYYYNPVRRHYWGRYDIEEKGYSMLAEADRKEKLEDIKDSAFPKPTKMPNMPDADDKVEMEVPPNDTPKGDPTKK